MSPAVTGKVTQRSLRDVQSAIRNRPARVFPLLRDEFQRWGNTWKNRVEARIGGATGPESLHNRTGFLKKSMHADVSGSSLNDLRLTLSSQGTNYARLQEFGGDIVAKDGGFLTIPTLANLRQGSSSVRYPTVASLRDAFNAPRRDATNKKAREGASLGKVVYLPSKRNPENKILWAAKGKGELKPYFVLTKKVTIPPRLGFFKTWRELAPQRTAGLERVARNSRSA